MGTAYVRYNANRWHWGTARTTSEKTWHDHVRSRWHAILFPILGSQRFMSSARRKKSAFCLTNHKNSTAPPYRSRGPMKGYTVLP